jgi:hypothetical protein
LKGQIRDSDAINFIEAEGQLFFYYWNCKKLSCYVID